MKYLVACSLWINAGSAMAIGNLKVATETGTGLPQFIVAVGAALLAIIVTFRKAG